MIGLGSKGFPEGVAELQGMIDRIGDLTPAYEIAAERIRKFIDDRFDTSTDPTGKPWPELSEKTIALRRKGSKKPLVDTSDLRNSIHADAHPDVVKWGTNKIYAGAHQFGLPWKTRKERPPKEGKKKRKRKSRAVLKEGDPHVPARPFLPVRRVGEGFEYIDEGPAAKMWQKCREDVAKYIAKNRSPGTAIVLRRPDA